MDFCPQCGTKITPNQCFCGYCGATLTPPPASASAEAPVVNPQIPPQEANPIPSVQHPMKWYNFVVYFQLFANCATNFLTALSAFTGSMYGAEVDAVYSAYPDLPLINTIYGVFLLFCCVTAIVARQKLYAFSRSGPKFYYIHLVVTVVASALYTIAAGSMAFDNPEASAYLPDIFSVLSNVVTTSVIIACNIKYFDKRKDLFVNP